MIYVASILVLVCIFLGMSVPYSFLGGAILYVYSTGSNTGMIGSTAMYALETASLLAIPLYLIAGNLMESSGIAGRLIDLAEMLLKKIKGGLGATIVLASAFFGAICGSGTATVAAISSIMAPRMQQKGWDKRYIAALIAMAGPLGYMIPPNMNAILYSMQTNTSINALFLSTVVPGILWMLLLMLVNRFTYRKWIHEPAQTVITKDTTDKALYDTKPQQLQKSVRQILFSAIPACLLPVIIMGGIYSGSFTATEAGGVACLYAVICGIWIYRGMTGRDVFKCFGSSAPSLAAIMLVVPMSSAFARLLVMNQVPQRICDFLTGISTNRIVILLIIDLIFFLAGFFLDTTILILVIAPLLTNTAVAVGIDLIQMGVILFVAVGLGSVTPPMAMNLFVASKACDVPVSDMIKPGLPFLLFAGVPIFLLVTFVPELSTWLPNLVMGVG